MPVGDAEERVGAIARLVGEHERADPRHVRLERDGQEVEHQAHVLAQVGRDAGGPGHSGCRPGGGISRFETSDPPLDLADRRKILLDLAPVVDAELCLQLPGVLADEVEDALLVAARGGVARPGRDRPSATGRVGRMPDGGRSPWASGGCPTSRRCWTSRRSYSRNRSSPPGPTDRSPARAKAGGSGVRSGMRRPGRSRHRPGCWRRRS